jgi:hypothetical protein
MVSATALLINSLTSALTCSSRRVPPQGEHELGDGLRFSLDLGEHAVDVVANVAAQPEPGRDGVHERPEAHALNDAGNPDERPDPLAHHSSVALPDAVPHIWRVGSGTKWRNPDAGRESGTRITGRELPPGCGR